MQICMVVQTDTMVYSIPEDKRIEKEKRWETLFFPKPGIIPTEKREANI